LVDPKDVPEIRKLLASLGYLPQINLSKSVEIKFIKYQNEYTFKNEEKSLSLDLHWKFTTLYLPNSSKFNFLDEKILKRVKISKNDVLTLPPENIFLVMCIHNYSHHWDQLSLLVDLLEFIKSQNDLNWSKINEMATKLRIKRIVLINLNLLKEIFGFDLSLVNKEFPSELTSNKVKKMSLELINQIFSDEKSHEIKLLRSFRDNIRFRDNFLAGLMDCVKDAFIPTNYELIKIRLPSFLFPLYHLFRPILLLIRYQA
jgi:hypothetical protein